MPVPLLKDLFVLPRFFLLLLSGYAALVPKKWLVSPLSLAREEPLM
jgi:hypothetical protein